MSLVQVDELCVTYGATPALSRTPEGMALMAGLIGVVSAIIGLRAAYVFDTPAGPSIVCIAALTFLVTSVFKAVRPQR